MGFYLAFGGVTTYPKGRRSSRSRAHRPRRSAPIRNRCALSRPRSLSRQTQRTRLHRPHGACSRASPRARAGAAAALTTANFERLFRPHQLHWGFHQLTAMFSKIRQNISARDAFELVQADLKKSSRKLVSNRWHPLKPSPQSTNICKPVAANVSALRSCCSAARPLRPSPMPAHAAWPPWWR